MYEWRRWSGHSLREFLELDGNGDGFVTPREVYVVIGFPDQDTVAGNSRESGSRTGEATTVSVPSGTSAPADSGGRVAAEATRYFGILDKDEDGAISAEEWASSIRIRGMFEDGGLDLSEPMPQDTFVQNYVSLSSADG